MALPAPSAVAPCRHLDRLPRGDDRTIGAGYAMAMAAAGAVVVYSVLAAVLTTLLAVSVLGGSSGPFLRNVPIGFLSLAVSSTAFLAPLAFVAGVVAWRLLPSSRQYAGAINGSIATILIYLFASVLFFLLANGGVIAAADGTGGTLGESVIGVVGVAGFAFVSTCWITLPLSILAGTLYERSRSPDE